MMDLQQAKQWWASLAPEAKRKYIFGGIAAGVLGAAFAFDHPNQRREQAQAIAQEEQNKTALVKPRVRDLSNEAMGAELDTLQRKLGEAEEVVKSVQKQQEDTTAVSENLKSKSQELDAMRNEMESLRQELSVLKSGIGDNGKPLDLPDIKAEQAQPSMPPVPAPKDRTPGANNFPSVEEGGNSSEAPAPKKPARPSLRMIGAGDQNGEAAAVSSAIAGADTAKAASSTSTTPSGEKAPIRPTLETYIPAGTILDGVLLTGMDAPASGVTERNPVPGLVRIKADAILPNKFSHDVKECFVILAGKGVLSTERVELRTETLSCVRNDGGVIETKLEGYATGEDGKAGVRGRLVSKQGAVLARSLMTGILSGFSRALTPVTVPALNISGGSTTGTQQLDPAAAARIGGYSGLNTAAMDLSKFYLDLAKELFPVLEVDAGRRLNVVLLRGTNLAFGVKR